MNDFSQYVELLGRNARKAAFHLARLDGATKVAVLLRIAKAIREGKSALIEANANDLKEASKAGLAPSLVARLILNDKRIAAMADGVEQIAAQTDPVGQVIEGYVRPNGLRITKMRVPLGVILFFYESRPNVTSDAAALCLKSGNAIILRGGKEAFHSNQAIVAIIKTALRDAGVDENAVQFIQTTDRNLIPLILKQDKYIDLVIPRGGESLIRAVVEQSRVPVLKHYKGVCHVFVDAAADLDMALAIVENAKCQRPGTCNAAETLLVHADVAAAFLPRFAQMCTRRKVEVRADEAARKIVPAFAAATEEDWYAEYLDLILAVRVVKDLRAAIDHINKYGSRHSDAIVTQDERNAKKFLTEVDSAAVFVNASTRLHDGFEFGLGAEMGISTDKLHARGPMGLEELTTYKYLVRGTGQLRQ